VKNFDCDLQFVFLSQPSEDLLQVLNQSDDFTLIKEITAGKDIDVKKILLENLNCKATVGNYGCESVLTKKGKDTKKEGFIKKDTSISSKKKVCFKKYIISTKDSARKLIKKSDFSQTEALPENVVKQNAEKIDLQKENSTEQLSDSTEELTKILDLSQAQALSENVLKENDEKIGLQKEDLTTDSYFSQTEPLPEIIVEVNAEKIDLQKEDSTEQLSDSTREIIEISDFFQVQALQENVKKEHAEKIDLQKENLTTENTEKTNSKETEQVSDLTTELTKISNFSRTEALPKNDAKHKAGKIDLQKENIEIIISNAHETKQSSDSITEFTEISNFSQAEALREKVFKNKTEKIDLQKEISTEENTEIIHSQKPEQKLQDSTTDEICFTNKTIESINCKIGESLEYLIVEPDIDFDHVSTDDDDYLEYESPEDSSFYNPKETYGQHFLSSSFDDSRNDTIIFKQNHHKRKITRTRKIKRQDIFNCPECAYVANHGYLLRRHIHTRHPHISSGLSSDHDCAYCNKPFVNARDNKNHVNAVHFKIKPYACGFCDKSFVQKVQLKIHFRTHSKFG